MYQKSNQANNFLARWNQLQKHVKTFKSRIAAAPPPNVTQRARTTRSIQQLTDGASEFLAKIATNHKIGAATLYFAICCDCRNADAC